MVNTMDQLFSMNKMTLELLTGVLMIIYMVNPTIVTTAKLYQHMENRHLSGKLQIINNSKSIQSCALRCLTKTIKICKGFAFSRTKFLRCIHIIDDTISTDLTSSTWDGYQLYYVARTDPMAKWTGPQPKLYFPLDEDTGSRHGPNPENMAFIGGGIVGNAFYNPIGGGSYSYYRLGHYAAPEYCFPVPTSCSLGLTVTFWAKILSDTGIGQGIMTTKPPTGQGFKILWEPSFNFKFLTERDFDSKEEVLKIDKQIFLDNYGYGNWVHYVFQYRFNGSNLGNNMNVYLNGVARPDNEKSFQAWPGTHGHDGDFELGHVHVRQNSKYGNIMVDEIIIWEEMLTQEQVLQLYEAYDN